MYTKAVLHAYCLLFFVTKIYGFIVLFFFCVCACV